MSDAEHTLARAAARGVHCLAVPTPFAVGRVNCYLIEDEPLTLLDAGPNSATSLTALEGALDARGHRVEDLRRIVVTHQHIDHIGLVQILATRSGAEVCALDRLAPWLADYKREMEENDSFSAAIMLRNGIPRDVVYALRAVSASFRAWGAAAQVTRPLRDGERLDFASRSWRVLHRSGHSPSDTVFWDEASGELFGGDHLIKHISSNPLLSKPLGLPSLRGDGGDRGKEEQRPKALMAYLDSLRLTREMDLSVVYPGHGEPVRDHRGLIDERFRMHERRADKLCGLIEARPRNAYELAQEMWGNVAVTQAFLTLSEVLGHVDLLIEAGRVVEREDGGVVRFQPAPTTLRPLPAATSARNRR
jgi:glyoxylase-like metal-dependent hydrolase (beta-lactamase superfamily II)